MFIKDWKISQLDSGHWIAEYKDDIQSSPKAAARGWVVAWVRARVAKENKKSKNLDKVYLT